MEDADEPVGDLAEGGVVAQAAAAELVVVGVDVGVVHGGGEGLLVEGVDEAVVVDEPGVHGPQFAGLAGDGCGAGGSFAGWVTIVATNQARQTYRSLKRRAVEQSAEVLPEAVDPRTTSVIAGSRLDLLEALENLESSHPQLVQPLVLRDLGAMTYAEIADELDVPLGTVKARIHQARKAVAERLTVH